MSQFRTGILPLEIETGRFTPIYDKKLKKNRHRTPNERICKMCNNNEIENEYHILCVCPKYDNVRKQLFNSAEKKTIDFVISTLEDKFIYLMKNCQLEVSQFIIEAWSLRQL